MYTQLEKQKNNNGKMFAKSTLKKNGSMNQCADFVDNRPGATGVSFVDNRPEAIAQRKLKEMAGNNSQLKQLRANSIIQRNDGEQDNTTARVIAGAGLGAYSTFVHRMIATPGYERSFLGIFRNINVIRAAPRPVQIATLISTAAMAGVGRMIGLPGALSQFIPGSE